MLKKYFLEFPKMDIFIFLLGPSVNRFHMYIDCQSSQATIKPNDLAWNYLGGHWYLCNIK